MDSFTLPQGELRAEFTSFAGFEPAPPPDTESRFTGE